MIAVVGIGDYRGCSDNNSSRQCCLQIITHAVVPNAVVPSADVPSAVVANAVHVVVTIAVPNKPTQPPTTHMCVIPPPPPVGRQGAGH